MEIFYWLLLISGGFLLGSIMFCELIPKIFLKRDVCEISVDHNPGTFNVFKHCGPKTGIPCLILDLSKGFIPVILASILMNANKIAFSFVLVAPVLGHAIGLFNKLHGGKCITVSFGVMLGLIPVTYIGIVALVALYVLFSAVIKIKSASIRSVVVFALFLTIVCPVLAAIGLICPAIGCGFVAVLPIIRFVFTKNGLVENKFRDYDFENGQTE